MTIAFDQQRSRVPEVATKYPVAWGKVSAAFGQDARQFFSQVSVDPGQASVATQLLRELLDQAPFGGEESAGHKAWRASIAGIEALVTRIAGPDANTVPSRASAIALLTSLLAAAQSSTETGWRAALDGLQSVIAVSRNHDDQSTVGQLKARIARARTRTNLPAGALSILGSIVVPSEPPGDTAFQTALAAARLFFLG